jgi:flagellar assembly factor FliW
MKCSSAIDLEEAPVASSSAVRLPNGLLGFEHFKKYLLVSNPGEEPFLWLQVKDKAGLAFVVVNPFLIVPDYQPDLPQADVRFLEIAQPDDAILLNIVTLHSAGRATVNLKGPIVVNRHSMIGKQVVLANASEYAIEHPLPLAEVTA